MERAERECVLNTQGLTLEGAEVHGTPVPFLERASKQEVAVGPLPPGTREFTLRFRGQVSQDSLAGFYRSRHGEGGQLLTTHLAPTTARRLFPCIDHPAAKAVFEVEVATAPDLEVVFNTDPRQVETRGNEKVWKFHPTPKMSTYLLYIGIGKFDTLEEARGGLRVAVKAPPGRKGDCAWGLENGHKSVAAFATYYGIPYPLPKLDLISVHDFAAGAMENWGAISFRESYLLANASTTTFFRQVVAEVVAHEIAHQWFGNLVTMEWWNDIWLNESFATFMSFKMVDRFYPDWNVYTHFLVGQTGPAMAGDSLEGTHAIDVKVDTAEDAFQIFDEISYGKGGSVLRMLEAHLGETAFRAGVGSYLKAHAYGNARGDDLWDALEQSSGAPVRRIIGPWIGRGGHPIIRVARHGRDDEVELTQQRFRLNGEHTSESWPVPLGVLAGGQSSRSLFEGGTMKLRLPLAGAFSLNADAVGFYRVLYDPESYRHLFAHMSEVPTNERWALLRDAYAFLQSGDLAPALYRDLIRSLGSEKSGTVVIEASSQALALYNLVGEEGPLVPDLRAFLRAQARRLGPARQEGEGPQGMVRERVHLALVWLDPEFARELAPRFLAWNDVDPDVRRAASVAYARSVGASAFEPLTQRLKGARNEGETEELISGLAAFRDAELEQKALAWATDGGISRGLMTSLGIAASLNPDVRPTVWEWFVGAVPTLEKIYAGTAMLPLMVETLIPYAGVGQEPRVRQQLAARPVAEADRAVLKGLELLSIRERLRRRLLQSPST